MLTNIILGIGFLIIWFLLLIVIISLARIGTSLNIISQVVALGIQKAGLVRTPDQLREDALASAEETEDESDLSL